LDYRASAVTQQEFKALVDEERKSKATISNNDGKNKSTKSTRSSKQKQPAAGSSSTAADSTVREETAASRTIELLGGDVKEFAERCDEVVTIMSSNHKEYIYRTNEEFHIRLIASGGLLWNDKSKNRSRDYMLAATAAVLESHIVPRYREGAIEKSPGAKELRKELSDYFFSIAKPNYIKVKNSEGEDVVVTLTEWKFADLLEVDEGPFPQLNFEAQAHQMRLEKSTRAAKETEEVHNAIVKLTTSEQLACFDQRPEDGCILETAAVYAITILRNVSGIRL
jgi:hypothetical protein